jgi:hypothetical protein
LGTYTLADFQGQFDDALGRSIDGTFAKQYRFINQALFVIAGAFRHEDLVTVGSFNTVVGTAQYTIAADCSVIYEVLNSTTPGYIRWIRNSEYYRRYSATNAIPEYWTRFGSQLALSKTPSAILAMKYIYQAQAAKMTAVGNTSGINSAWDIVISHLATCFGLMSVNEEQRASIFFQSAVALAQAIIPDDDRLAKLSIESGFPKLDEAQVQQGGQQ